MSGELVPRADVDSWVPMLGAVGDLASKIASTEFVAKSMRGRAPAVAGAILAGRERGLGPMVSLAGIDVIDGRPALSAQLLAALVYRAGHRIVVIESSDKAAEVKIERGDGLGEAQVRWTMADAQRAGLASKTNWQRYPRQMLYARALSEAARMAAPDVALGLDVDATVAEPADPTTPRPATVVQLTRTDTETDATRPTDAMQPARVDEVAAQENVIDTHATSDAEAVEHVSVEPLITAAQMRKIGALIGQWETLENRKLDRDERRRFIGFMAGVPNPDTLQSAKDLTKTQASEAIEQLQAAIEQATTEADDTARPPDDQGEDQRLL
jgi:hypothetical protein